jgi:hypothetical protein
MTIRVTRLRHEDRRFVVDVYLDGDLVASLPAGASVHVHGTGTPQQLEAHARGLVSQPVTVTDPGENSWIGIIVGWERPVLNLRHPFRSLGGMRIVARVIPHDEDPPTPP